MVKDTFFQKKKSLRFRDSVYMLNKPIIMGIINLTSDSFYSGSRIQTQKEVVGKINQMLNEGATIIDIGAASSRPNSEIITAEEEINRLKPFVEIISKEFPRTWFSVDTYNAQTAEFCVEEHGFYMINDISAYSIDKEMFETVVKLNVPYVLMHMQGNPQNMQQNPEYRDVSEEVFRFLGHKIAELTSKGVNDIIIDPGFGFGKDLKHNYTLLKHLDDFRALECPVLAGLSRKSMIYRLLNNSPEESLNGTSVLNTIALLKGADILRVHDVKAAKEAIEMTGFYLNA